MSIFSRLARSHRSKGPEHEQLLSIKRHGTSKRLHIGRNHGERILPEISILADTLEVLEVAHCEIKDISAVATLHQLQTLTLNGIPVSDISALGQLASLSKLELIRMSSVKKGLPNVTSLRDLRITECPAGILAKDVSFGNLETLKIKGVLEHPNILNSNPNLKCLDVVQRAGQAKRPEDLSSLAGLSKLEELNLLSDCVEDIAPLTSLGALHTATINANSVTDISPLASLSNLTELWLATPSAVDFSSLKSLCNLTKLRMDNAAAQTDIGWLSALGNLDHLSLRVGEHADLSPLLDIANLKFLYMEIDGVVDLSPLSRMSSLTMLVLRSHAGFLSACSLPAPANLKDYALGDATLGHVNGLQGCLALESLHARGCNLSDLSALKGLPKLRYMDLSDTNVSDLNVLKTLSAFTAFRSEARLELQNTPMVKRNPSLQYLSDSTKRRDGHLASQELAQEALRLV